MMKRKLILSALAMTSFAGAAHVEAAVYYRLPVNGAAPAQPSPGSSGGSTDSSGGPPAIGGDSVPSTGTPASGPAVSLPAERRVRLGSPLTVTPTTDLSGAITWTSIGQEPPAGMQFDANGILTGTPSVEGTYPGLALRAEDSKGAFGLSGAMKIVVAGPLAVAPLGQFTLGRVGVPFKFPNLTATNALGALTWSVIDGPDWMGVTGNVAGGMPNVRAQDVLTVQAYDTFDGSVDTTQTIPLIYPAFAIDKPNDLTLFTGQPGNMEIHSDGIIRLTLFELLRNGSLLGDGLSALCPGMVWASDSMNFLNGSTLPCEVDGLQIRVTDDNMGYMPPSVATSPAFKLSVVPAYAKDVFPVRYTTTSQFLIANPGKLNGMADGNGESSVIIRDGQGPRAEYPYLVTVDCVRFNGSNERANPGVGTNIRVEVTGASGVAETVGVGVLQVGTYTSLSFAPKLASTVSAIGQDGGGKTYEMDDFVPGTMQGGVCQLPGFAS